MDMKKNNLLLCILAVFVIILLVAGCGLQGPSPITSTQKDTKAQQEPTKTQPKPKPEPEPVQYVVEDEPEEEPEEEEEVLNIGSGDESLGLVSKGDYRDKKVNEKCDFDYPFHCAEYLAREGVLYLSLKYEGYPSKIEEVEVYLDGDLCEPDGNDMEPGTRKDFTCYFDPSLSTYSGDFELKYYHKIDRLHKIKSGVIVVNNV
jgi:predicted small lipoprotein YifL